MQGHQKASGLTIHLLPFSILHLSFTVASAIAASMAPISQKRTRLRLAEGVDDVDAADGARGAEVFGVKRTDAVADAGGEEQGVPE